MDFLETCRNEGKQIVNQLNASHMEQVKENRKRLIPIIESIMFLGRQNISLRGHRDDGPIEFSHDIDSDGVRYHCKTSLTNEGNFRELLRFRVLAGDNDLAKQLESSSKNATYISKTTQNELIRTIGDNIQQSILSNVKRAQFYSVIFDETTDVSKTEQLSLTIRYVHDGVVREDCRIY